MAVVTGRQAQVTRLDLSGSHSSDQKTRWPNAGLMLAHRLRRWANIKTALGQRVVIAEPPI